MPDLLSATYEGHGIVKLTEEPVGVQAHQRVAIIIVPAVSPQDLPTANVSSEVGLKEITRNLLTLEARLWEFERKHGLKSADFARLANEGKLGDLDGSEDHLEFIEWLGLYQIWQNLKTKYDERVASTSDLAAVIQ